jgi:hypothetical protein
MRQGFEENMEPVGEEAPSSLIASKGCYGIAGNFAVCVTGVICISPSRNTNEGTMVPWERTEGPSPARSPHDHA